MMALDPPANSSIWNQLSQDDKSEYIRIREEFHQNQKVTSKDRRVVTFRKELLTVLQFLERGPDNLETRCILTGICFAGPIVCVNTRQLKSFLCRCKSSINGSFQQLGYLALKTKSKTRSCVVAVLPSLMNHQNILRQWTVRVVSDEAQFCFVSSFSNAKIPVKIEEDDLFFEKNMTDSAAIQPPPRQFPMQMPFYQQQQYNMMNMPFNYNPPMVNSLSQPNLQAFRICQPMPMQPQQQQFNPCMNFYNQHQMTPSINFLNNQNQFCSQQQHQHRQKPQLQHFQEFQNQSQNTQNQEQEQSKSHTFDQSQSSEHNKVHFISQMKQNQNAVSFGAFVPPSSMPTRSTTLYPYPLSKDEQGQQFPVSVKPTVIDSDLESADSEFDTPPESDTIPTDGIDELDNINTLNDFNINRNEDNSHSFSVNRYKNTQFHDVDYQFPQIEDKNPNENDINFNIGNLENDNQDIIDADPNAPFLPIFFTDQPKTLSRSKSAKIHYDNWDTFDDFF